MELGDSGFPDFLKALLGAMKTQGQRKEYQDREKSSVARVEGVPTLTATALCCSAPPQGRLGLPELLGGIQPSPGSFHKAGKRMSYSEAARHSGKLCNRNERGPIVLVKYLKHL